MADDHSILDDPEYKASLDRLEQAIRDHHRLLENWGNEHDSEPPDNTVVAGWVLTIGQVGFNDGQEFHAAVVEYPNTLNSFMAVGLADYGLRYVRSQTDDYSD